MVTQKNHLDETVLLSTQNICLNWWVRKWAQFYAKKLLNWPYGRRKKLFCLFDLILYVPSTIFQLNRDGSSWVEPVLSLDKCVLLKDHKRSDPSGPLGLESSTLPLSHPPPPPKKKLWLGGYYSYHLKAVRLDHTASGLIPVTMSV